MPEIIRSTGLVKPNSYIVKLRPGVNTMVHANWLNSYLYAVEGLSQITHLHWTRFDAYAGLFSGQSLYILSQSSDVEYIQEDSLVSTQWETVQQNAPWHLARVSNANWIEGRSPYTFYYQHIYDTAYLGAGVDIYILDTGVLIGHQDFGGRAMIGKTCTESDPYDMDRVGHGTHCAGIAAGTRFGVAKEATIISVKVLSNMPSGHGASDVISGIDWVMQRVAQTGRPSVMSMSLGCPYDRFLNYSSTLATTAGIHVVAAAGNYNQPASLYSPASADEITTVGACNNNNMRWQTANPNVGTNTGPPISLFAPGENVMSCGIAHYDEFVPKSGTSMATPVVAGIIACMISQYGRISPWEMRQKLMGTGLKRVIKDLPWGTNNILVQSRGEYSL